MVGGGRQVSRDFQWCFIMEPAMELGSEVSLANSWIGFGTSRTNRSGQPVFTEKFYVQLPCLSFSFSLPS